MHYFLNFALKHVFSIVFSIVIQLQVPGFRIWLFVPAEETDVGLHRISCWYFKWEPTCYALIEKCQNIIPFSPNALSNSRTE